MNPEKRQARSATRVLEEAMRSLTDANNGLAKLYGGPREEFLDLQEGKDWKAEARACGTDLAGYFNDYRKWYPSNAVEQISICSTLHQQSLFALCSEPSTTWIPQPYSCASTRGLGEEILHALEPLA